MKAKALLFLAGWALAAPPLRAEPATHARATLVSETRTMKPGEPFWVAVRFEIDDGWHIYWKNQGDSGLPTRFTWALPEGFRADAVQWPAPQRFEQAENANYGYEKEAIFLTKLYPPSDFKLKEASMTVHARWMECADVCVPAKASIGLKVPADAAEAKPDGKTRALFERARARLPQPEADLKTDAKLSSETIRLKLESPALAGATYAYFFSENRGVVKHSAPQKLERQGAAIALEIPRSNAPEKPLTALKGVLVYRREKEVSRAFPLLLPIR